MPDAVQRFRKKPVVIEAMHLTRDNFDAVGEWAGVSECWGLDAPLPALHIETLEGRMKAYLGDWVIRGPFPTGDRQFYPCKPDIFAEAYEPAGDPEVPGA